MFYATAVWGPGLANDSFSYLTSARNLIDGKGLVVPRIGQDVPLTAWPPLFPAVISLLGLFGLELCQAAGILNALLFMASVFLAARLIRASTTSGFPAFAGAMVLALSPTLLRAHSNVWSEPLFLFLCLVSITILAKYSTKPSAPMAVLFGLVAGLSSMARYPGLTMISTGVLTALLLVRERVFVRIWHSVLILIPGLLPVALWFARNAYYTGRAANRRIVFRPPTLADILQVSGDASLWILPKAAPVLARAAALALAVSAVVWLAIVVLRRYRRHISGSFPVIVIIFVVCYEAFIVVTSLLADSAILAEERIQLPVLLMAVIFIFSTVPGLIRDKKALKVMAGLAIVFMALSCGRALEWAGEAHRNGQSFSCARWAASSTVQQVRNIPPGVQIFSNSPQLIYAQTHRVTWFLPSHIDFTRLPNARWKEDWAAVQRHMSENKDIIVVFRRLNTWTPSLEPEIESALHVQRIFEDPDGVIFASAM